MSSSDLMMLYTFASSANRLTDDSRLLTRCLVAQRKPVLAAMIRGVDLVRKVLNSSIIVSSRRLIHTAFSKHLFITNVTISLSLSGFGDLLQQRHNLVYRQQEAWDPARTRHMTCSGITVGALCHHWYNLLDRRLPGRTIQVSLKKLLVDQLLFSPVCLTVFFLSLGLFKGGDWQEFLTDLRHKGWRLYAAEWLVWPPVQLFNFYFLPTKFRVLFDNTASLLFDVYTSHVCYDAKFAEEEEDQGKITGLQKEGKEMSVLDLHEKNSGEGRPSLSYNKHKEEIKENEYKMVPEQNMDGEKRIRKVKTVTFVESGMDCGDAS
ncbi:hypothetical protein Pcinc_019886 [Petrolisthes cinctipes]|uniref:Mpv17-like protein 2 n=1 Tax=Petrolisthes cinctipes TaxID=88211 RepID=A0AAE1FKM5_PETCI|nr:hypothetical protein Pcinc_019886 [Petrolisthes cinctipes]